MANYHRVCCNSVGKAVVIRTRDGMVHRGIIHSVNNSHVFIRPLPTRRLGGRGYGYWGRGYGGYGYGGYGRGIALAAIAALAFLPFFFW